MHSKVKLLETRAVTCILNENHNWDDYMCEEEKDILSNQLNGLEIMI